jgi:HK97 family phage major capsid protein
MRQSLLDNPGRARGSQEPTASLTEIVGAAIGHATGFDTGRRNELGHALTRAGAPIQGVNGAGAAEYSLPPALSRSMLPGRFSNTRELDGVETIRTGTGFSGPDVGFTLPVEMTPEVGDRARSTVGPYSLCNWWAVPTREYLFPVVNEVSQVGGQRYGGLNSVWGLNEITLPAEGDGKVAQIRFVAQRLLMYTSITRDIAEDSQKLNRWLYYTAAAEIRNMLEFAMLQGVVSGPTGAIVAPSTVTVSKGTTASNAISVANVESMWEAIGEDNSDRCVWHANKQTIAFLDSLSVSGQFPTAIYMPAGTSPVGTPYGTIFGKPLIPSKFAAKLGNPGDLIAVDWSDYVMSYLAPKPDALSVSFYIDAIDPTFRRGIRGFPLNSVEERVSDQVLWNTDQLAIVWKFRGTGRFLWQGPATSPYGTTVGPCAVVAQR